MMISLEQIRAARGLLGWTQEDLAKAANLSKPLVNTLERRLANPKIETLAAIQRALEDGGVEFTEGPGVKLRSTPLKTMIFEGENSLVRLCHDIFDTLKDTDKELMISGIAENKFRNLGGEQIIEEIRRRVKHNIKTKLLSCEGDTDFIEPKHHYRWLPKEFFSEVPTYIYDNKYAMFLWGPPKKVVLIENAEIAESYRKQFLTHWERAKVPS